MGSGNWCSRIVAPPGRNSDVWSCKRFGIPDVVVPSGAMQHAVEDLPEETLVFLLGSRYCETDLLSVTAWQLFEKHNSGVGRGCRRSAISFTTILLSTISSRARRERPGKRSMSEQGVCRDYAHLARRVLQMHEYSRAVPHRLPRRYWNSRRPTGLWILAAWFDVYRSGAEWYTFDARQQHACA